MPTIEATIGAADANSYVTDEEFLAFIDERFDATDYDDFTADERARALISAARRLNQESYLYPTLDSTQALKFPLALLIWLDGIEYDTDVIPTPIKYAQMTLALMYLNGSYTTDDPGYLPFESLSQGDQSLTVRSGFTPGQLPAQVKRFLRGLVTSSDGTVLKVRG